MKIQAWLPAALLAAMACSGSNGNIDASAPSADASGIEAVGDAAPDGAAGDAGGSQANDATVSDAGPRPEGDTYGAGCPASLPAGGSPCTVATSCSYGDSTDGDCRNRATCDGSTWAVTPSTCPAPTPAASCPVQATDGAPCTASAFCRYANGFDCECAAGTWFCDGPVPMAGGCPSIVPNEGTPCTVTNGGTCSYGCRELTANALTASCTDAGVWIWDLATCKHDDGNPDASGGSDGEADAAGDAMSDAAGDAMSDAASDAACVPRTCDDFDYNCGSAPDGCGGTIACGDCTPPETCGGGGGYHQCGSFLSIDGGGCLTCAGVPYSCSRQSDGCGGLVASCFAGDGPCFIRGTTCGGGGLPFQCGTGGPPCQPVTCADLGYNCGAFGDGCQGVLHCGTCTAPQFCGGGGYNLCGP
jgi:hypothetical protein